MQKLQVEPEQLIYLPEVSFSRAGYGRVQAIAVWDSQYQEPLYLVTNFALACEAAWYYHQRFYIETRFSDQKSRGFRLERSHISDPKRMARLLLAAALAYLWLIYLGTVALTNS